MHRTIRGSVKYWISLILATALAQQQANFTYQAYSGDELVAEYSGRVCAEMPNRILLQPEDKVFATTLVENGHAKLIDYRLQQLTVLDLHGQPFYEQVLALHSLQDFCYEGGHQRHCLKFIGTKQANCSLAVNIPSDFEIIGENI